MKRGLGVAAAVVAAAVMVAQPAAAQGTGGQPPDPGVPGGMSSEDFQGLTCLVGAGVAVAGALLYGEFLAAAAVTAATETAGTAAAQATLLAPILGTAVVAGCGVGSVISPGLWWIYKHTR